MVVAAVILLGRQGEGCGQVDRRGRAVQIGFDIVIAQHAVHGENVEAIANHHEPTRLGQALGEDAGAGRAIGIAGDGIDAANATAAGEERAVRPFSDGAHAGDTMGIDLGVEARRQAQRGNRHLVQRGHGQARGVGGEGRALGAANGPTRHRCLGEGGARDQHCSRAEE